MICAAAPPDVSISTSLTAGVRPGTNDWWNSSSAAYPATMSMAASAQVRRVFPPPGTYRPQNQNAEHEIFHEMPCFADVVMHEQQGVVGSFREQPVQNRNNDRGSMLVREWPVEKTEISTAQRTTGHKRRTQSDLDEPPAGLPLACAGLDERIGNYSSR